MTLLDELSGFEFEETMAVVFDRLGYEGVEVAPRVADTGRDIIMLDPEDETAVIVECKHTDVVGRPDIQKLDSAVNTYEHDGPTRGMIATTGRLTDPALDYAKAVDIEVLDGRRLREIAENIGMDLYNGRIEIVCDTMLPPADLTAPFAPVQDVIDDVANLDWSVLPIPDSTVTLVPTIVAVTHVQRTFETGAGIIHHVNTRNRHVLDASRGGPEAFPPSVKSLIGDHLTAKVDRDPDALESTYTEVNRRRFGQTETEYRDHVVDRAVRQTTTTVRYTGDNNVTYEKVCEPSRSDVTIDEFDAVYAPRVYATVNLENREYVVDWYGAGDAFEVTEETFRSCRICADETAETPRDLAYLAGLIEKAIGTVSYTYCANCGRVVCQAHIRTERVIGEPVCTACGTSNRFFGARRYFFDEANLDSFTETFRERSMADKLRENPVGIAAIVGLILVALLVVLLG